MTYQEAINCRTYKHCMTLIGLKTPKNNTFYEIILPLPYPESVFSQNPTLDGTTHVQEIVAHIKSTDFAVFLWCREVGETKNFKLFQTAEFENQ